MSAEETKPQAAPPPRDSGKSGAGSAFVTLNEAALRLGLTGEQVRALAQKRELRAFTDCGVMRFRGDEVEKLALRRGAAPTQQAVPQALLAEPNQKVRVQCRKCGKSLKVAADQAGKRGKCPACGEAMLIGVAIAGGSGLMWQQFPSEEPMPYAAAADHSRALRLGGPGVWRLPTLEEARSMLQDPALLSQLAQASALFWTCTSFEHDSSRFYASDGSTFGKAEKFQVRAVRSAREPVTAVSPARAPTPICDRCKKETPQNELVAIPGFSICRACDAELGNRIMGSFGVVTRFRSSS